MSIEHLHGLGGLTPIAPTPQGEQDHAIPTGDDFSSQLDALIGKEPASAEAPAHCHPGTL